MAKYVSGSVSVAMEYQNQSVTVGMGKDHVVMSFILAGCTTIGITMKREDAVAMARATLNLDQDIELQIKESEQ